MEFRYKDYFKAEPSTGYETLIYDCMIGDDILFQRADSVEAGWRAVQPFLDAWKKAGANGLADLPGRQRGSRRGRRAADARRPQLAKARLDDGCERRSPYHRRRRSGRAGEDRRGSRARADRRQWRPHRDLPDRRIEPEAALRVARRPTPIAAESRGTACIGSSATSASCRPDDPLNNMAHGARRFPRSHARRPPTSIRSRPIPPIPTKPRERYEPSCKSFYGARPARSRAAAVRSRADGRRARRPYRLAVSRLSGARRNRALGGRRAQAHVEPFVPRVTLTLPALASCREMLFEVGGRRTSARS